MAFRGLAVRHKTPVELEKQAVNHRALSSVSDTRFTVTGGLAGHLLFVRAVPRCRIILYSAIRSARKTERARSRYNDRLSLVRLGRHPRSRDGRGRRLNRVGRFCC